MDCMFASYGDGDFHPCISNSCIFCKLKQSKVRETTFLWFIFTLFYYFTDKSLSPAGKRKVEALQNDTFLPLQEFKYV